jgi:Trk-type K+ transport system membrane component
MSSQAVIGAQFELQAVPVHAPRSARDVVKEWLREHVKQFVFVRVCIFISLVFVFACVFYAIEVTSNPIYAVGRNISAHDPNATLAPATGIPTELNFIDALFVSTSMLSNTGLTTVDFSLWSFASQVIGIVTMLVGCLPISSSVPLWVRLMVTRRDGGSKYAEYKALQLVTVVILVYFCFFCIFLSFMFAMTCALTPAISAVFLSAVPPVNPFFGGYFIAAAAFSNCGFSPLSNSVISLGPFPGIIIWLSFLILVGNIAFPALLRFILGAMHRLGLERRWGLPISLCETICFVFIIFF